MKKTIFKVIIIINISLYAQCNSITHLDHNLTNVKPSQSGYYYKDINNVFNDFEGIYLYTNNNISFKIKLQKKTMSSMNGVYCEDMIIGGAEYIKNGELQFNSIPLLSTYYSNGFKYNLYSNSIYTGDTKGCDDCEINEKWLIGYIIDPTTSQSCEIFIRKIIHNGQAALKIRIHVDVSRRVHKEGENTPLPIKLPIGEDYILIKQ